MQMYRPWGNSGGCDVGAECARSTILVRADVRLYFAPAGSARRSARREAAAPYKGEQEGSIVARMLADGDGAVGYCGGVAHPESGGGHCVRVHYDIYHAAHVPSVVADSAELWI